MYWVSCARTHTALRSCASSTRTCSSLSVSSSRATRALLSLSVHLSLSLPPPPLSPPFFLCRFYAFWPRVRSLSLALSRSLPVALRPFLSLSLILFSVAFTLLAARALSRALFLSLPLSPFVY
jgi:hypothetical protein